MAMAARWLVRSTWPLARCLEIARLTIRGLTRTRRAGRGSAPSATAVRRAGPRLREWRCLGPTSPHPPAVAAIDPRLAGLLRPGVGNTRDSSLSAGML